MKRAFNTIGKPDDFPAKGSGTSYYTTSVNRVWTIRHLLTFETVALVERNVEPHGIPLIDPEAVAKTSRQDLVALATRIEKAEDFVKAIAYNKLQVTAE